MYISDRLKDVANSVGAIKSFGGDIFGATEEGAEKASDAIDELNGKLLDFDKFRALNESEDNQVAIDEKLLEALSKYESILASASNSARELANAWKGINTNNAIISAFEDIYEIIGFISEDERFKLFIDTFLQDVEPLFNFLINEIDVVGFIKNLLSFLSAIYPVLKPLLQVFYGIFEVIGSIINLISSAFGLLSRFGILWEILAGVFGFVSDVIYTLLRLITALIDSISTMLSLNFDKLGSIWQQFGIDIAGAWASSGSAIKIGTYASGGLPDKGTMFVAGEAGAEMVYNMPNGQSGVANVQQIKQAMLGALLEYGRTQGSNGQPIEVYLDGEKVYQNTTRHAKKRGQVWGMV
jgi:hypothetical protein